MQLLVCTSFRTRRRTQASATFCTPSTLIRWNSARSSAQYRFSPARWKIASHLPANASTLSRSSRSPKTPSYFPSRSAIDSSELFLWRNATGRKPLATAERSRCAPMNPFAPVMPIRSGAIAGRTLLQDGLDRSTPFICQSVGADASRESPSSRWLIRLRDPHASFACSSRSVVPLPRHAGQRRDRRPREGRPAQGEPRHHRDAGEPFVRQLLRGAAVRASRSISCRPVRARRPSLRRRSRLREGGGPSRLPQLEPRRRCAAWDEEGPLLQAGQLLPRTGSQPRVGRFAPGGKLQPSDEYAAGQPE